MALRHNLMRGRCPYCGRTLRYANIPNRGPVMAHAKGDGEHCRGLIASGRDLVSRATADAARQAQSDALWGDWTVTVGDADKGRVYMQNRRWHWQRNTGGVDVMPPHSKKSDVVALVARVCLADPATVRLTKKEPS